MIDALGRALIRFVKRWQNWIAVFGLVSIALIGIRLWPHQPLKDWKPSSVAVYDEVLCLRSATTSQATPDGQGCVPSTDPGFIQRTVDRIAFDRNGHKNKRHCACNKCNAPRSRWRACAAR